DSVRTWLWLWAWLINCRSVTRIRSRSFTARSILFNRRRSLNSWISRLIPVILPLLGLLLRLPGRALLGLDLIGGRDVLGGRLARGHLEALDALQDLTRRLGDVLLGIDDLVEALEVTHEILRQLEHLGEGAGVVLDEGILGRGRRQDATVGHRAFLGLFHPRVDHANKVEPAGDIILGRTLERNLSHDLAVFAFLCGLDVVGDDDMLGEVDSGVDDLAIHVGEPS